MKSGEGDEPGGRSLVPKGRFGMARAFQRRVASIVSPVPKGRLKLGMAEILIVYQRIAGSHSSCEVWS
jgi:hypothetical protein